MYVAPDNYASTVLQRLHGRLAQYHDQLREPVRMQSPGFDYVARSMERATRIAPARRSVYFEGSRPLESRVGKTHQPNTRGRGVGFGPSRTGYSCRY